MKKILALLFLLFVPFMVKAEDLVKISKIELIEKTDTVEIMEEPTFEGLNINVHLNFSKVGEIVKYKVTVKNNSKKDYEMENSTKFNDGEYIKYEITLDEKNTVIKAGEEKDITLTISYVKEVPEDAFVDGKVTEKNSSVIVLSNNDEEKNPYTKSGIAIIIAIAVLALIITITLISKKKALLLLIIPVMLIPVTIFALEKLSINIQTDIVIDQYKTARAYFCEEKPTDFIYRPGMTWEDFFDSELYENIDGFIKRDFENYIIEEVEQGGIIDGMIFTKPGFDECFEPLEHPNLDDYTNPEEYQEAEDEFYDAIDACYAEFAEEFKITDEIISKNSGHYKGVACK
jgi:hypothetical protein